MKTKAFFLIAAFPFIANASQIDTDRPSRTDNQVTVPKGLSQLEFEVASYTHSRARADQLSIGAFEARLGLSDRSDLQVQFAPFVSERPGGGKSPATTDGIGDTTVRLKLNLLGDDSDASGVAVLPYVKIPTAVNGNGKVEGGLLFPMQLMIAKDTSLDFEVGGSSKRTDDTNDNVFQFVSSYALTQKFGEKLQAYLEFYSESQPHTEWNATVDTGAAYLIDDNNQVDAGINVGVSPTADPFNPFVGYSVRF